MFILGNFVDTRVMLWTLFLAFVSMLILAVVFIVLYVHSEENANNVANTTTVTGQVQPSYYVNKQALSSVSGNIKNGSWRRIVCVGDDAFGTVVAPDTLNGQNASVTYLLSALLQNNTSQPIVSNIFGYDNALSDNRVNMTGNWTSGNPQIGVGGRFFATTNASDTITYKSNQRFNYTYFAFYTLTSSAAFTISEAGNSTQTVTPASLTPIPNTSIVRVSYLTSNAPSEAYSKLTITATGATASRPVQIVGIALENGYPQIVDACVSGYNSQTLLQSTQNTPTSLCGAGLNMLSPDLVIFYPPFSDYTSSSSSTLTQAQTVAAVKTFLDSCASAAVPVLAVTPHFVPNTLVQESTQTSLSQALVSLYMKYTNIMIYDFRGDMGSYNNETALRLYNTNNSSSVSLSQLGGTRLAQGIYNAFYQ